MGLFPKKQGVIADLGILPKDYIVFPIQIGKFLFFVSKSIFIEKLLYKYDIIE